jgi:uncharacterized protein YndB with AHSA1/START domain
MTEEHTVASTCASRLIGSRPEEVYEAFMNPAALVEWLPPGEMTGKNVAVLSANRAFLPR